MSKREKLKARLLSQKTLSSDETIRLLELDDWIPDPDNPQRGSHKYFVHPVKKDKVTIPTGRKVLPKDTRDDILRQAGLTGD